MARSLINGIVSLLERLRKIPAPVRKHLPWIFLAFFLLFLFLIAPQRMVSILIVLLLLAAASVSTIYKRLTQISVGIELISFVAILLLFAFGPVMAIIGVLITTLLSAVIEGQPDSFPKQFFATSLACLIMIPFLSLSLLYGGMLFVALRNVILFVMYKVLYGSGFLSAFGPVALNLVLNYLLLEKAGETILKLLAG
ncbi:hypothetical protein HYU19_02125 [Candidatus Woesearchaeota archaeon]|nr:hypothetical protein [Candidatus Woesearchaeota archaeon]